MKYKIFNIVLLGSLVIYFTNSCKEVDVLTKSTSETILLDTTYIASTVESADLKTVLLEEFTGVRCINCSVGHSTAEAIKTANPGRVITLAHHSLFLDAAYPFSFYNLSNVDAEALSTFLGPVNSKPSASIDRKLYTGESSKILDLAKWTTKVNEELATSSPVNIHLTSTYNAADTSTLLTFTAHFTQALSDPLKFTIMLYETNITTAQLLPTTEIDTNYVHKDVLRNVTTDVEGNALGTATITAGRVFIKQYKLKLESDWKADNMHIVAFIHKSGSSYDVLQAAEVSFK